MKFCPRCGVQCADEAAFCSNCGTVFAAQQPNPTHPNYGQQPGYNQQVGYNQQPPQPNFVDMPMKWHKFLIYFSLWASGISNILVGIMYLSGKWYDFVNGEGASSIVYNVIDGLKTVDIMYGMFAIALGVFAIFTRFQLAGFKATAPKMLTALYAGTAVISLIYFLAASSIIEKASGGLADFDNSGMLASILGTVVGIVINTIYYKKRQHMFVN